ncbi:uncharacterized protein METZ01_LOCUS499888, partial [marine metagenome]
FKGTFIPLTTTTTIGDRWDTSETLDHGHFDIGAHLSTSGTVTVQPDGDLEYTETGDADLAAKIAALDSYHDPITPTNPGGTDKVAYLAIRFWDVRVGDSAGDVAGATNISGGDFDSLYNTLTNTTNEGAAADFSDATDWRWADSLTGGGNEAPPLSLHHDTTGNIRTDHEWELPIHIYDQDGATSITSDTSFLPNSGSVSDLNEFAAVITYFDPAGDGIVAAEFDGDKILSNLE